MNSNEITINNISSDDLYHALSLMPERNIIVNQLFQLMADDYGLFETVYNLQAGWVHQQIELAELLTMIFEALEPEIPVAPESIEIDFDTVTTITKTYRRFGPGLIFIHFDDKSFMEVKSKAPEYKAVSTLVHDEISERGLIDCGKDSSEFYIFIAEPTTKKLTESQSRALATLLKAQSNYELELANAEEGKRVYHNTYFDNDQVNKQSVKALAKRGLIRSHNGYSSYKLSDAGLALAKELHPEYTVAGILEAQNEQATREQQVVVIKRAMREHYAEELNYPHAKIIIGGGFALVGHKGVENLTFQFTHNYQVENYGRVYDQSIKIQLIHSKVWNINIIASDRGEGSKYGETAINIPSDQIFVFAELIEQASDLKATLDTGDITPYTGELLTD